jgi:poly-gamma-glutamate capsule biosynthesis protein CapA/YwtB (metallophosphatase superfamily)
MRLLILSLVLLISTQKIFSQQRVNDTIPENDPHLVIDTLKSKADTISIIGVGDIMMGTNYPENKLPPNDGELLLKNVKSVLQDASLTFGNLEGTLLDSGGTPKSCRDPKVCYVFRTPVRYVKNLVDAGFDVMSLANNHAGDFGDIGRKSSMKTLGEANLEYAGQLAKPYTIFTKDSITYGVVAFAPNSGCVNLNDIEGGKKIVAHLDSIADIVIVSFHGGAEGATFQHVPRADELFHGENRGDVYKFAHEMIDAGADVIFGHGPHVTRAVDIYKDRFIAYSMGNFCTYRGISVTGVNGLAPIIKIYTDTTGKFLKGKIIPTYQSYETGVRFDAEKQVIGIIRELTKKDFPESAIHIDENGLISYLAY